jgi:hypothetical protein
MAIKDWPGGVVSDEPVVPAGPYQDGAASGVWHISQVSDYVEQGIWPIAGSGLTPIAVNAQTDTTTNGYSFFNVASTGNAAIFGNLLYSRSQMMGGVSSSTRGLWAGGSGSGEDKVEYVTFASSGNGVLFGNLSSGFFQGAGASNSTRGIWFCANQSSPTNRIEYNTIASTGNTVFFGSATASARGRGAAATPTRALSALGLKF